MFDGYARQNQNMLQRLQHALRQAGTLLLSSLGQLINRARLLQSQHR